MEDNGYGIFGNRRCSIIRWIDYQEDVKFPEFPQYVYYDRELEYFVLKNMNNKQEAAFFIRLFKEAAENDEPKLLLEKTSIRHFLKKVFLILEEKASYCLEDFFLDVQVRKDLITQSKHGIILNNELHISILDFFNIYETFLEKMEKSVVIFSTYLKTTTKTFPINPISSINSVSYTGQTRTLQTLYNIEKLAKLRKLLIGQKYISDIKENDFIYWFSGKPIIDMPKIHWNKSKSEVMYLLDSICINLNLTTANKCIVTDNKGLDSNNRKGKYKEIDNILKTLRPV